MFIQRATAFDHTLSFADSHSDDITAICTRLDGIPLAIELASARVSALGVRALRDRLDKGLPTTAGARDLPLRQQTMLATVSWSYGLLSEAERTLLNRLSVFVDGFTLAAAESVCSADGIETNTVGELLASVFDKSLINATSRAGDRFRLLDSVRSFAAARLAEDDTAQTLARRHAEWLANFADRIDVERVTITAEKLRSATSPELENARAALQWAFGSGSDEGALLAARIVGGLRTMWLTSGRRAECKRWAARALERIDEARDPFIAARLLKALIQSTGGEEMYAFVERAIPVFERTGDRSGLALLYIHLAEKYRRCDRWEEAEAAIARSAELLSGFESMWPTPYVTFLFERCQLSTMQGLFDAARADIEKGTEIDASRGDRNLVKWRNLQAELDFVSGREAEAITAVAALAATMTHEIELNSAALQTHCNLAVLKTAGGDLEGGYEAVRDVMRLVPTYDRLQIGELLGTSLDFLLAVALVASSRTEPRRAAAILGAVDFAKGREPRLRIEQRGFGPDVILRRRLLVELQNTMSNDELHAAWLEGYRLPPDSLLSQLVEI